MANAPLSENILDTPKGGEGLADLWKMVKRAFGARSVKHELDPEVPSRGYEENLAYLRLSLGQPADLVVREFQIGGGDLRAAVLYLDQITDKSKVAEQILLPLSSYVGLIGKAATSATEARKFVVSGEAKESLCLRQSQRQLLLGNALLLIRGYRPVLICSAAAAIGRSVSAAEVETAILGPKSAFVEQLAVNIALIRQKLRTHRLRVESYCLGSETNTEVRLLYLEGVAPAQMLAEVQDRLSRVDVTEILDVSYLSEILGISPLSPFPQAIYTERPDKVVGNLLEGRVAILADGSPEALVLPAAFSDLFQAAGDYYMRPTTAFMLRVLRAIAFLLAAAGPAFYVAILTFDYELLPTDLTIPVATARSGLPFTPVQEALIMLFLVDVLQEGAIRLPARIGQTLGVVGGLVLGQAVIQANLISPLLLIVVASAVVSSFAMPNYQVNGLIRVLRYLFLLGASILGGAGLLFVVNAVLVHMSALTVLGVPYLRPVSPLRLADMSDFIYRKPYRDRSPASARRLKGSSEHDRE